MSSSLPATHRAAQSTPPNFFQTISLNAQAQIPSIPKSGTYTIVRVHTASINPVDYKLATSPWPISRLILGPPPITPGADFVGHVHSTNDPRLAPGDAVWGMIMGPSRYGTCSEFVVVAGTSWVARVPTEFSRNLEEFGVFGVAGMTALKALTAGEIGFAKEWKANGRVDGQGGNVFINGGSGGVGTFMVQMAKRAMGREAVVASCSGANVDLVKSLGADEVIDYRTTNVVEALKEWSSRHAGEKFDLIIDNVGSDAEIYWQSEHYLKPGNEGGRFITVAGNNSLKQMSDFAKILLWPSVLGGGKRPWQFLLLRNVNEKEWEQVNRWMTDGSLKSVVEDGNKFDLDQIDKAFEKLRTGRTRGKIAVRVSNEP